MKSVKQCLIILSILVFLAIGIKEADAQDSFGITIEQRALDVLTLARQHMSEIYGASDLNQVISMKAKIIVSDIAPPDDIMGQIPQMIFWAKIEISRSQSGENCPYLVRVILNSSFGELQFIVSECGKERIALAALTEDKVYSKIDIPQMLPDKMILPEDGGGLFTMLNLLGGIPFGSLLRQTTAEGAEPDVTFVEELDPSNLHAVVRYRGKDKTPAGMVHVVSVMTSGVAKYRQSMKIWVLEDSMDLYQVSIEDERGTEVFIVFDKFDTNPVLPPETFTLADIGREISNEEFLQNLILKMFTSPVIEKPTVLDIYASSQVVARTGVLTISTDGFDMQDIEKALTCQVEYKGPGGSWMPLRNTEYAGLSPMGHWNATFAPNDAAQLGAYSFRARFVDSSGNTSEWLEALNMVTVTPAPPRVVSTKPIKFESDVPISSKITVTFSKLMNKESVESDFYISSESGRRVEGSFTWDEKTLTFSPSDDMEPSMKHIVKIAGSSTDIDSISLDGNYDGSSDGVPFDDYVWSFKTTAARPVLRFLVIKEPIYKGDIFDIRILGMYITGMYKFSLKVVFDPKLLIAEGVDETSFLQWSPRSKFVKESDRWRDTVIDNSAGVITLTCDATKSDGVDGTGFIAIMNFRAISAGKTNLKFQDVSISNPSGEPINVILRSYEMEVLEFHPMDVNHDGVVDIRDLAAKASEGEEIARAASYPTRFDLGGNYPNPFNPETWIPYQLAEPSHVTITIYSSNGQIVRSLDLGHKDAGIYMNRMKAAYWDGTNDAGQKVSSGIYFYTIKADGFTATRKMLLSK